MSARSIFTNTLPANGNEPSPSQRIIEEVISWRGVTAGFGERGEFAFKVAGREIGHLHGDRAAHFLFDLQTRAALKEAGRVTDHPIFPSHPRLAARRMKTDDDVEDVIALMRLNYRAAMDRPPQVRDVAG